MTRWAAAAATVALLTACTAIDTGEPADSPTPTTMTPAATTPGSEPTTPEPATPGTSAPPGTTAPSTDPPVQGADVLPADYPWEPRQSPPPEGDVATDGEPWLGGLSSADPDEQLEVAAEGAGPFGVTGVAAYEEGENQTRVVVTYEGDGVAGLMTGVTGPTELPADVELPDGVDTAFVLLPGATSPLGGGLEPGGRVDLPDLRRVEGVSVGPPGAEGTTVYVGLPEGTKVWYVVEHPGTLVIIATEPGG